MLKNDWERKHYLILKHLMCLVFFMKSKAPKGRPSLGGCVPQWSTFHYRFKLMRCLLDLFFFFMGSFTITFVCLFISG